MRRSFVGQAAIALTAMWFSTIIAAQQPAADPPNSPIRAEQRPPSDLPQPDVTPNDFPGSIAIPDSDMAFKIGAQVRATAVHTLGPLGQDDRFVTSSIPVGPRPPGDAARTVYTAEPSRINLEFRAASPFGGIRTFAEMDFAGSSSAARLRHAYLQTRSFLFGQTWSTFSDPEAKPTDVDFEGLNAISLFRQAQVRYTHRLRADLEVSAALENPAPQLTGAQGVNVMPDIIGRVRWVPHHLLAHVLNEVSHIQTAVIVRGLRGEVVGQPDVTASTPGVGVTASGVLVPWWDRSGLVKFAGYWGQGIGRYIKDLEVLGGQDAVYDTISNRLRSLPVVSGYLGYERQWRPKVLSGFTYGVVHVDSLDIQPVDALRRTQRATATFTWRPAPRADLIVEFLVGSRLNKDGETGQSSQLQAGWIVKF